MGRRIVFSTIGSLGDVHPYLALAIELKARGHEPALATSPVYRDKVESAGIRFHPMRPDLRPDTPGFLNRVMDQRHGVDYLLREVLLPHLRDGYEDLLAASEGADLLVSHVITFMLPLVAEKTGIPWISTMLAPIGFLSASDPSIPPQAPWLAKLRGLGPGFHRWLFSVARWRTRFWMRPVYELRRELGLSEGGHPLFEGQHSSKLVLALFSRYFAPPQPDWPPHTHATGFAFYDQLVHGAGMPPGMDEYLRAGPPPVVFTLGSSAVFTSGDFYEQSAEAAKLAGVRALMLTGPDRPKLAGMPGVFPYAPYSELFPHAAAIVHQGGIGTCAQAMRAGKPMLIVPFSHDQPDNAWRLERLGVARHLGRGDYSARKVAAILRNMLSDAGIERNASALGEKIRSENGVKIACDLIEGVLR